MAVKGLMAIPPPCSDPEQARLYFRRLRELVLRLLRQPISTISLKELPMGMSNDYHVAVEEGARWCASSRLLLECGVLSPTITSKIAFIGSGQMAEAMIGGLLSGQVCTAESIWATDPVAERRDHLKGQFGIQVGPANREAVAWADVIVLAVKPQALPAVLIELGPILAHALVISIVAGVTIRTIAEQAGGATRVVRAMPNTPALVLEGMTALAMGAGVSDEDVRLVRTIFEAVGLVVAVEEGLMDAVTGLSGSGPAYVFLAIEALADGGVKMGLPRQTA